MPEGWKEAVEMAERYRDYFREHDADIALGRSGTHFFYVYNREYGYFEVFHTFRTAAELEVLILGALAEDLECMNSVMAENLHERFDLTDINETLDNFEPRFHMHTLAEQLKAVSEQCGQWGGMLARTYQSLCGRLPEE